MNTLYNCFLVTLYIVYYTNAL